MAIQKTFFDPPAKRTATPAPAIAVRPETSRKAAQKIRPRIGRLQARVFEFIRDRGPLGVTDEELVESLNMSPNTLRPRRVELRNIGAIIDSGRRRPTRSGRDAAIWILAKGERTPGASVIPCEMPAPWEADDAEQSATKEMIASARRLAEAVPGVRCADAIGMLLDTARACRLEIGKEDKLGNEGFPSNSPAYQPEPST